MKELKLQKGISALLSLAPSTEEWLSAKIFIRFLAVEGTKWGKNTEVRGCCPLCPVFQESTQMFLPRCSGSVREEDVAKPARRGDCWLLLSDPTWHVLVSSCMWPYVRGRTTSERMEKAWTRLKTWTGTRRTLKVFNNLIICYTNATSE